MNFGINKQALSFKQRKNDRVSYCYSIKLKMQNEKIYLLTFLLAVKLLADFPFTARTVYL